jgi:hypothetical protein
MEKTAVEFIFDAVYRDIPFSELLGIIAQARIMEKQQDNKMYSEEDMFKFLDFINNRYYGSFSIDKEDLQEWFEQFKKK